MEYPNFNKQILNTLENGKTTVDELKAIEPIMIENCKSSIKLMYSYYFATIVLAILWFLVDKSIVTEVNVLDVAINNKQILLLSIPFLSITCYYFTISYMAFNQLIDAGLKQIQRKLYPNISESSMMELLIYPSLIELESIKVRLSNDSLLSNLGFIFISFLFLFAPLILNGVICWNLLFNTWTPIIFPIIYILIIGKIVSNVMFYIKQVL
jgi:hypothetical protein